MVIIASQPLIYTGTRPVTAAAGQIRFNTNTNLAEIYDGANWVAVTEGTVKPKPFTVIREYMPDHHIVDVTSEVLVWVTTQPVSMWKYHYDDAPEDSTLIRIIMSDKLITWATLRWESA